MPNLSSLYSEATLQSRVKELAAQIRADLDAYPNIHAVVAMNGAFMFAADLIRQLNLPLEMHFAGASSYHGMTQGALEINADALPPSFGNQPVLLIEDIMDSGNTINALRKIMVERQASVIKTVALLKRQGAEGQLDYNGFTVPRGLFVVGYGLDLDGRYRDLKDLKTFDAATMAKGTTGFC